MQSANGTQDALRDDDRKKAYRAASIDDDGILHGDC
jgi:hypothetical protein